MRGHCGFTLAELLVALVIIGIVAAILFSALGKARASSRQTTCVSNLRQLAQAVEMYRRDYDDVFPLGGDPGDVYTSGWIGTPWESVMSTVRPLPDVMEAYVKNRELWHCPADSGFDKTGQLEDVVLNGRPSSFEKFGMSYAYNSYLGAAQKHLSDSLGYSPVAPYPERAPSTIPLLLDPVGFWHGGDNRATKRFNYVFCDGHVKTIDRDEADKLWRILYVRP